MGATIIAGVLFDWLTFLGVLVGAGLLLAGVSVFMMARMLLGPRRMSDARALRLLGRLSPDDVGLHTYEEMPFRVRDAQRDDGSTITLTAWWIPQRPEVARGRCAILVHGYGDAKVGALAWAPTFHDFGYHVLTIDLRAHGESGGSHSTAGFFERHDLNQVINDLRASRPDETRTLVLFGVSLGAACVLAAAEQRERETGHGDVAGVILESPFADYKRAVAAHGHILGYPGGVLRDAGVALAERLSGADFDAVRPVDLVPRLRAPLMLLLSGDDPFVPPADAAMLEDAARQRPADRVTRVWTIAECPHVFGLAVCTDEYQHRLGEFLERIETPAPEPAPAPLRV